LPYTVNVFPGTASGKTANAASSKKFRRARRSGIPPGRKLSV
jgi:hypothetical protein